MHLRDTRRPALLAGLTLLLLLTLAVACVIPVQTAPGLRGQVVDRTTGQPVANAIVVVRFDGRHGDQLPDRELLGHAEATTGPDGSFQIERYSRSGASLWPVFQSETRIVSVLRSGYRCPDPLHVTGVRDVRVEIEPALDQKDRQASCRPVASRRGEAEAHRVAWRELYPPSESPAQRAERRQLGRTLEARTALGYGANCSGPVVDLALAPDGMRVAFAVTTGDGVDLELVDITPAGTRASRTAATADDVPPRRLAWTQPGELVLWSPARLGGRSAAASIFSAGHTEVMWKSSQALPAAIDPNAQTARTRPPLEPDDLSDETDTRWLGRSFSLERSLDLSSGLSRDRLLVRREDGSKFDMVLPGEACGGARFGRPQYRVGAGGRLAFDLRYVEGGCHAVAIDLTSGAWSRIDASRAAGQCRTQRAMPPALLATALRGWTRELHDAMHGQGIDTGSTYALTIRDGGATSVLGRNAEGLAVTGEVPNFPISTPLDRIDITHVSPHGGGIRLAPDAGPAKIAPL